MAVSKAFKVIVMKDPHFEAHLKQALKGEVTEIRFTDRFTVRIQGNRFKLLFDEGDEEIQSAPHPFLSPAQCRDSRRSGMGPKGENAMYLKLLRIEF